MTRKKVTLAFISNDSKRRASFRKRKRGLLKKVSEISTLCGVQACAIIYGPYDQEPEVWPNRGGVREVLDRYRRLSDLEKSRKMVNQETFTRQRVKKKEEQVLRLQKENDRRELESFVFKYISGFASLQDFDLRNSVEMGCIVDQSVSDLASMIDGLTINDQGGSTSATAAPAAAETGGGSMENYLLNLICGDGPEWGMVPQPQPQPQPQPHQYIYDNGSQDGARPMTNFKI